MLVVAALRAHREQAGLAFEILALSRHTELLELADALGATSGRLLDTDGTNLEDQLADVVIDTTGNPEALELAVRLARREVLAERRARAPEQAVRLGAHRRVEGLNGEHELRHLGRRGPIAEPLPVKPRTQ